MNDDQYSGDGTLTRELRDSLSELAMPERPPLAAITKRGSARRRRRLAGLTGLSVTSVAGGTALVVGLTGVFAAARAPGTIRTAAFTLTSNANGTDTLTLTMSQVLDPGALQQALEQHGIPALVKVGVSCWSSPAAPDPVSAGVLSTRPLITPPQGSTVPTLNQWTPLANPGGPDLVKLHAEEIGVGTVMVINPAAMPSGTELDFQYLDVRDVLTSLIYTRSNTCSAPQPQATPQPSATP
jgi:hypothetical protein